jgi:two-component system response regulator AtoC
MPDQARILVVDDDRAMGQVVCEALRERRYHSVYVRSAEAALQHLDREPVSVVISDLHMPTMNGIELCERMARDWPDLPVVLMTAFGSVDRALVAVRAGAFDFLLKPFDMDELLIRVERALEHRALAEELKQLRTRSAADDGGLLGESPAMQRALALIARVAGSDANVLITGETGTGKELAARTIHAQSRRAGGPFVAINCAALPETLLESELFGHVKGAFTDARSDRKGLFQHAHGGSLLLDEVGEMPAALQGKLLRVLQERRVRPVGSDSELPVDVRVISATHRDLETLSAEGRFREDLYYRLNVVPLELPPLRSRGADIVHLAQTFASAAAARAGKDPPGVSPQCAQRMLDYPWPGNIRELQNAMERAVALAAAPLLEIRDLPEKVQGYRRSHVLIVSDDPSELVPMQEVERRYVLRVLEAASGNKTRAAQILGFDRKTLYAKLKQYGVDDKS